MVFQTRADVASAPTVLVADDDESIREAIGMVLEDLGYRVCEAADGEEALRLMRESAYPLVVLLDYMMPVLDGADVLRITEGDPTLAARHRVVLATASPQLLPRALHATMAKLHVGLLAKPFDMDHLLAILHEAVTGLETASIHSLN